jgi:hypothetical protein
MGFDSHRLHHLIIQYNPIRCINPLEIAGFFVTVNPIKFFIMLFVDTKVDVQYRNGGISVEKDSKRSIYKRTRKKKQ